MTDADLLDRALRLEHAVIYLMASVGAHLPDAQRDLVRAAVDDHRRHRDLLLVEVRRAGGQPSASEVAYADAAPPTLTGAVVLQKSAVRAYDGLCGLLAAPEQRGLAATLLVVEAEHLARLHFAGIPRLATSTSAYPGR